MSNSILIPVESSTIKSIGYLPVKRLLYVQFKRGDLYEYKNVPAKEFRALMAAESKGRYLANFIRDSFEFRRVEKPQDEKPLINTLFDDRYSLGSVSSSGIWF